MDYKTDIKLVEHDVQLLYSALSGQNPHDPNLGQVGFIQYRLNGNENTLNTLLGRDDVPHNVKQQIQNVMVGLKTVDQQLTAVENGKTAELGNAIKTLNNVDNLLKFLA